MTLSSLTTDVLGALTPDAVGVSLGYPNYSSLAKVIYPHPYYTIFQLTKKDGTDRVIASPGRKVKRAQRRLVTVLNELDGSRPSVHGFREGKSVATNAAVHALSPVRKTFVFNLDLKDFFASITFKRVRGIFRAKPFEFSFEKASIYAHLCCHAGSLPQGAPTSPALSNYACRALDGALQRLAREGRATYTRYADDITFSFSRRSVRDLPASIVSVSGGTVQPGAQLRRVIDDNGFVINDAKVRLRSKHQRMEVTGLAINDVPNVRRIFVDEVRGGLQAWESYGLALAQSAFEARPYRRSTRTGRHPDLAKYLRGKLLYLRMAKGGSDRVFVRLARRFNECVAATPGCKAKRLGVVPTVIDQAGLVQAVFPFSARNAATEMKGSAFFLHGIGIVTCDHCLRDEKGQYFDPVGQFFLQDIYETDLAPLDVVWRDKDADVAVMWFRDHTMVPHLWLPPSPVPAVIGDPAKLVGFPAPSPGKQMTTTPARVLQRYASWGRQHLDIDALIRSGNSGGPLLDSDLRVMGIAKEGATQSKGNNAVLTIAELVALHAGHFIGPPKP